MKILISGLKPFLSYKENITEKIANNFKGRKDIKTIVFPVRFDKKIFSSAINAYKTDVVLGLGMCPDGMQIRIERRAKNLKNGRGRELVKINNNGPQRLLVNLRLKSDKNSKVSYDAGSYVCNYYMYVASEIAEKENIKFAFLHIPEKYDIKKANNFIESKIREINK